MISKEKFLETMKALEREREFQDKLNVLLNEYCSIDSAYFSYNLEKIILSLLKDVFEDEFDWIDYAVYEIDMLRSYREGSCYDGDGKIIDISTWSKLYDVLLEYKDKE